MRTSQKGREASPTALGFLGCHKFDPMKFHLHMEISMPEFLAPLLASLKIFFAYLEYERYKLEVLDSVQSFSLTVLLGLFLCIPSAFDPHFLQDACRWFCNRNLTYF